MATKVEGQGGTPERAPMGEVIDTDIAALPWLDFQKVYGPFYISVGLMMWAFLSGLILLAGAHFSATQHALRLLRAELEDAP